MDSESNTTNEEKIEYKILLGAPTCKLNLITNTSEDSWKFDNVRLKNSFVSSELVNSSFIRTETLDV